MGEKEVGKKCARRDNQSGGGSIELFESPQFLGGIGDCKQCDLLALLAAGPKPIPRPRPPLPSGLCQF